MPELIFWLAVIALIAWRLSGRKRGRAGRRSRDGGSFYLQREWRAIARDTRAANKRWFKGFLTCELCKDSENHWRRSRWLLFFRKKTPLHFHTDHIKPRSLYPHLELHPDWTQVLCQRCNTQKGNRSTFNWERVNRWPAPFRWVGRSVGKMIT
jgi:5-methylcytosine-specific restriction endonuclease McrA